jgi:hypothetical protein
MLRSASVTAIFFVASASTMLGQQLPSPSPPPNPSVGGNISGFISTKTPYEFWLTCIIGFLGLSIIASLIWAIRKSANFRPEDITRPIIIITVIVGTLILVTAGYSNEQIAPAFGLFGTIVGYILGRLTPPGNAGSTDAPGDTARNVPQVETGEPGNLAPNAHGAKPPGS